MTTLKKFSLLLIIAGPLALAGCKKDKKSAPTPPVLTTAEVTNITANTATGGGTITGDGGGTIIVSGICWSKTNPTPTTSDDTTKTTTASGSFSSIMTGIEPSSTYYVRAYAINEAGTGYGNVVTFTTGNAPPVATDVAVTGNAEAGATLTATYTYTDAENDAENSSTLQWYAANDAAGAGETAITGATSLTYVIKDEDEGKYIRFGVTPKAAAGSVTGIEVKSSFIGAIGEATSVTFVYNGDSVTYGILTSAATGRKWLDRNLGAANAPTAVNDYQNYGDLFQWGRAADGHQLVSRTGVTDADITGVNGVITTLSTSDDPGHSDFIDGSALPNDWTSPGNPNLWQGVDGINNPCPAGWRIPTREEWAAENIMGVVDGFAKLKLTFSGFRVAAGAGFLFSEEGGYYHSSTVDASIDPDRSIRIRYNTATDASGYQENTANRAGGYACRCIKD
jgi:hypothetical protein